MFQNFALVIIFKMLPRLWVLTLNSQKHIYIRPLTGLTPTRVSLGFVTFWKSFLTFGQFFVSGFLQEKSVSGTIWFSANEKFFRGENPCLTLRNLEPVDIFHR